MLSGELQSKGRIKNSVVPLFIGVPAVAESVLPTEYGVA
jgi:hypothetical protein